MAQTSRIRLPPLRVICREKWLRFETCMHESRTVVVVDLSSIPSPTINDRIRVSSSTLILTCSSAWANDVRDKITLEKKKKKRFAFPLPFNPKFIQWQTIFEIKFEREKKKKKSFLFAPPRLNISSMISWRKPFCVPSRGACYAR